MRHAANSRTGPRYQIPTTMFPMCILCLLQDTMRGHLLWCFLYRLRGCDVDIVHSRWNIRVEWLTRSSIAQCILPHKMIAQHLLALCPSMSCICNTYPVTTMIVEGTYGRAICP